MRSIVYDQNTDSLSDSMVNIDYGEIKAGLIGALESRKNQHQGDLEKLNSALNQREYSDLIEIWNKLDSDAELNDASTLAGLIAGKIAGFDREQLLEMLDFSKISYGDRDRKLKKDGYKTKRQLAEEGYRIIQFFEDERTENQYCPDEDYKLEQRNYGYDLICSNSWNRDAGYVFIKDREVTIAYHGTRDGSDFKTDLYAYLTKLPFSPEGDSVHSGFYSLFKRSWPSVHKILKGYANDQGVKIKDLKINVTGHSMGGALASIAALCLNKTENAENVHVATFGSPRVFYKDAAKVYNDGCLRNKTIRVACRSDNIPCLPPGGGHEYYKHVGQALKLGVNETTFIPDVTLHYHRLNTYRSLIKDIKQENFKSDNVSSWWRYLAYPFGKLSSNIPVKISEDSDKEFFKKVEEENEDIKLSEISKECSPSLEKELKQKEQEVAQLTNDKTQLEKRLKSIQQSLAEKTKELDDEKGKLTQEQQKTSKLDGQVDQLTKELKGIKDQLVGKKAELDEQTRKVTKLNSTIDGFKETNAELERKNSNLTSQLEKFAATNAKLEKNVGNLNNQFAEEKKALEDLKVQSEQNEKEFKKKIEELNSIKQDQASKIAVLTAEITELKEAKTKLEGKAEFTRKELEDTQAQLKEREEELDIAKNNASQLKEELKQAQQSLAAKTKEFENVVNKLQKGLNEKTREAAQFEEENSNLASQAGELKRKCKQTEVQLVASKQKLAEETSKVTQLSKESNEAKAQLEGKKEEIGKLKVQVTQLKNENNDLKTRLQESENKSKELEKNLKKQSESKDEELNEKFLKARIYSKKQGNYASVSFVLSGAFAVGTSLTMVHLAMCVSLAVAALAFLAVGCYCSYKANTALNNVKIENDSYRIAA
ncbi:lipase family protein [Wolbachia endosymbiont (group B) of Silvanus unidentatus]|uniref:lipase family protein n=1 Tax=Wolbachia endosymbiont (group B) of Silvanus unidentatus TaxID=3066137 RepID=UPI0033423294